LRHFHLRREDLQSRTAPTPCERDPPNLETGRRILADRSVGPARMVAAVALHVLSAPRDADYREAIPRLLVRLQHDRRVCRSLLRLQDARPRAGGKGARSRVHALFLRVRDRAFREEARLRPSFAPATPRLR